MILYFNIFEYDSYTVYVHRRARREYTLVEENIKKTIDMLPLSSYASFDDDNVVGDIVILHERDHVEGIEKDMDKHKAKFVPINKNERIGIFK